MTTVSEVQRALTTQIRDLPTDLAKRYQAKLEGYRADFEPRGTLENDLVAEMAHLVLQLEQTRAVAAAVVAIHVETVAFSARPAQPPPSGRGPAATIATRGWPRSTCRRWPSTPRPTATRCAGTTTRASEGCTVRSPHSSSSARPPPSPDAIPPNPSASTPAPQRSTLVPALRARRAKSSGSPTHPSTSPATAFRPPRRIGNSIPSRAMSAPTAWSPPAP